MAKSPATTPSSASASASAVSKRARAPRKRTATPQKADTGTALSPLPSPRQAAAAVVDGIGQQVRQLAGEWAGKATQGLVSSLTGGLKAGGKAGMAGVAGGLAGSVAQAVVHGLQQGLPMDAARLLLQALASAGLTPARAARAGTALRKLREAAGLTAEEVSRALDLNDPALIEQLEHGKVALPFELILRLAGVLGRNDPIGFVMKLTRSANPALWQTLDDLGVGRLVVQGAREREFANLYRANDAARQLSDADFAVVLAFTRSAFETAMAFHGQQRGGGGRKPAKAGKGDSAPAAGGDADAG